MLNLRRLRFMYRVLVVLLVLVSPLPVAAGGPVVRPKVGTTPTWSLRSLEGPVNTNGTSIALDSQSRPGISYARTFPVLTQGYVLRYAHLTSSGWVTTTVDDHRGELEGQGNVGWFSSVALDGADGAHFSSNLSSYRMLGVRYATPGGSDWVNETVANSKTGTYTSLALDRLDSYKPRISYHQDDPSSEVMYARWDGATWNISEVAPDGGNGGFTSLALHPATSAPWISYFNSEDMRVHIAHQTGATWSNEKLEYFGAFQGGGTRTSLRLSATAPYTPQLAYSNPNTSVVMYAYRGPSGWITSTVDSSVTGQGVALDLDPTTNAPRIVYSDGATNSLYLAAYDQGAWQRFAVRTNSLAMGDQVALAIDHGGNPHISFVEAVDDLSVLSVRYATANLNFNHLNPVAYLPLVNRH